ncbi:hypothetical protein BgiMline_035615, partial [Biomphalaria glabrata]
IHFFLKLTCNSTFYLALSGMMWSNGAVSINRQDGSNIIRIIVDYTISRLFI